MKILILTAFLITFIHRTTGQEIYKIALNSMVIKGTSNIHKWEEKIGQIQGTVTLLIEGEQITGIAEGQIEIPVKSIKSTKGNIMDNKTYQALKSENCPNITLKLSNSIANGSEIKTTALLTIACTSKTIDLISAIRPLGNNQFVITGNKKLKMTDYGIKPPTALLGTMVTGDEITIEFDVKLIK